MVETIGFVESEGRQRYLLNISKTSQHGVFRDTLSNSSTSQPFFLRQVIMVWKTTVSTYPRMEEDLDGSYTHVKIVDFANKKQH